MNKPPKIEAMPAPRWPLGIAAGDTEWPTLVGGREEKPYVDPCSDGVFYFISSGPARLTRCPRAPGPPRTQWKVWPRRLPVSRLSHPSADGWEITIPEDDLIPSHPSCCWSFLSTVRPSWFMGDFFFWCRPDIKSKNWNPIPIVMVISAFLEFFQIHSMCLVSSLLWFLFSFLWNMQANHIISSSSRGSDILWFSRLTAMYVL